MSGPDTVALDGSAVGIELVGGKAAALDRLVGHGLRVPPCAAATTEAYRRVVAGPRVREVIDEIVAGASVGADAVDEVFAAAPVPEDLRAELAAVASRVAGGGRIAVRSSATVEDLAGSSFAGQYRSILDVDPADVDALESAVKLVFASLWHPAPCAYRAAFGLDSSTAAMAAVLMRMVPATRAGVVFTVDPGGVVDHARVEMVEGLGESLVSGRRTPEAFVLPRVPPRGSGRGGDEPEEVAAALGAAMRVEEIAGTPQDVEWAWDGADLWVVQARPITVGRRDERGDGFDSPLDDHELTTAGIGEMLPGVLPPLVWDLNRVLVNEAFRDLVTGLGVPGEDLDQRPFVRRVRGRAALDFGRLRDLAQELPGGSSEELELQYFGSRRPGRPAAAPTRSSRISSLVHDVRAGSLRRRANLDAEICIEAVAALVEDLPELDMMSDDDLLAYRGRLFDLALRAAIAEMAVAAAATTAYRKIEILLLPHTGGDDAGRFAELVTTGRGITVTPHRDASAAVFGGPTWRELERLPVTPTGRESPTHAWHELLRALAESPSWGGDGFRAVLRSRVLRRLVEDAVTLLRRREAAKAALLRAGGEMRRVHREAGERLVGAGALVDPTDIELLTGVELVAAMAGSPLAPVELAARRRWLDGCRAEPPLPVRFVGSPVPEVVDLPAEGRFEGWAASSGRHVGTGVVVHDAADHLPEGAVLVASTTDASWSPLFLRAGAIVVERGGPLSHAAILARELGVPAVLNVAGATQHLDGVTVTVDGDAGIVVVHEAAPA